MAIEDAKTLFLNGFSIVLTEREAQQFARYEIYFIQGAIAAAKRWILRKSQCIPPITITRNGIVRSVQNTLDYRSGHPKPTPKAMPKVKSLAERVEELRIAVQNLCSTEAHPWALLPEEAQSLLEQYGSEPVLAVSKDVGRFDEANAQECIDLITFRLGMAEVTR